MFDCVRSAERRGRVKRCLKLTRPCPVSLGRKAPMSVLGFRQLPVHTGEFQGLGATSRSTAASLGCMVALRAMTGGPSASGGNDARTRRFDPRPWQDSRPSRLSTTMTVVKALNLASFACQLLALCLATRIDLKALAISRAQSDLPETFLTDAYIAARDGKPHTPSDEEMKLRELEGANDERRNGALLRWSGTLIAFSILLQGIATCISPD